MLREWELMPSFMKTDGVKEYYDKLLNRNLYLCVKRLFGFLLSLLLIIICLIPFVIIAIIVKLDSKGPVLYLQERVTQYGKLFKVYKFRTMINDADKIGPQVTVDNDQRVTRSGRFLRKYRIDELPQLFNVLLGDMSFVGVRPEVKKFVDCYTDEMNATLLLPAGVTSNTSIAFKDESEYFKGCDDADSCYIDKILPEKMKMNLEYIENISFKIDIGIIFKTIKEVL